MTLRDEQLTPEAFDRLLLWLDADRNRAAERYEFIRLRLIKMFIARGCVDAEGLADETINRVIRKISYLEDGYTGEPAAYFAAVARYVYLEYTKARHPKELLPFEDRHPAEAASEESEERSYDALSRCLDRLAVKDRELILEYYREGRGKHAQRRELAAHFKVSMIALRQRASRIRSALKRCIKAELADDRPD